MSTRRRWIAAAIVGTLIVLVLLVRTPVRKWWNRNFEKREISAGLFQDPEGMAIDSEGNVYVGDEDRGELTMLDADGKVVTRFKTVEGYRDGDGQPGAVTRGCSMVAIEPRHLVLVARHNVAELTIEGTTPRLVRIIGSRGSAPGQMDGPEGMSRDTNGDLYVTDEHNRRINVFDKDGKFVRFWTVPQDPQSVRVWKDRVYVALNKRGYISCFTKDGQEKFRIGGEVLYPLILYAAAAALVIAGGTLLMLKKRRGALVACAVIAALAGLGCLADYWRHLQPGQFRLPDHICVSPDGKLLYITDRTNARIQVFDTEGNFKFTFGRPGTGPGEFRDPKDVAFDPQGRLWALDSDNHRLQILSAFGTPLRVVE